MNFSPIFQNNEPYRYPKREKTINAMEAKSGKQVLDLGIGNPGKKPDKKIFDFVQKNLSHCEGNEATDFIQKYPTINEKITFQNAVKKYYAKNFKVKLENNEIFPVEGAKKGIRLVVKTILSHTKKKLLIPNPYYPAYKTIAEMENVTTDFYDLNEHRIGNIEKKIKTGKFRIVVLNFPNNPTGMVTTLEELKKMVQLAKKYEVTVLYDNAYRAITYENYQAPSILQIPDAKEVCIEAMSLSKSDSVAGLRIGFLAGNEKIIEKISILDSKISSGVPNIISSIGSFILNSNTKKNIENTKKYYAKSKKNIEKILKKSGLKSENKILGGLYMWCKIPDTFKNVDEYVLHILKKHKIFLVPGNVFGPAGERYVRVCFSNVMT